MGATVTLERMFAVTRSQVSNLIAVVVTVAWAVSFVWDLTHTNYEPPASLSPAFLAVVGGIYGAGVIRRNGNGSS